MRMILLALVIIAYVVVTSGLSYFDRLVKNEVEQDLEEHVPQEENDSRKWVDEALYIDELEQPTKPKLTDITSKYESKFENLKQETIDHIEQLKQDVLNEVNEDSNPLTLGVTIIKYEKKADELERQIDEKFNELFQTYLSELKQFGYTTNPVKQLERKYSRTKRSIKNDLVQEANAWIEDQKRF
ncbi:hypothetical protein [Tenuibacillus multivorans]|uniref:Uncharacterized protein n=1 Tax=Tenuibacillus multivorans TaxID=237069 RepID=A0A1H0G630_9BACI|nr:hypothetical protein [Tenuibacillus multivorans]GEL78814.1 hypothetical protein TMU01_30490 [Tenuibacillus multivorans]SDO02199.1 hypothetical protein SAMN05216498_0466 [Tenuibacillus multivorans]